ncbi:carboxymuconolactone decarboxylase family protein [Mycolicibacter kumamotonensis]|uniref:Carboxymuconolactone decarboxylase-like domain-containing protein n=1 Tax=Mycolicibacter kumamotonensis TaxID=354243 RepID=A0A1B8S904_9MYCO|nr:carboxymuconolactone decarboxylase family protein [Mycolicibacter kumamotonensis]OBY29223.1 hypothetical protein ACT18_24215 [Mycolicibacter kumamotonensis]
MSRIPRFHPDDLDESQRRLYAAIVEGRAGITPVVPLTDDEGVLTGPFNAMLLSPELGMALQELGTAIRHRSALLPRARELAILAVAAHWQCQFELDAHALIGAQVGLTAVELDALRGGSELQLYDNEEAATLTIARTLVRTADPGASDYDAAASMLGPSKLFEISTLVGYYSLLALQMRIFDMSQPPEPSADASSRTRQ